MSLDSVYSLRYLLLFVISVTVLVVINMTWCLGYLYASFTLSSFHSKSLAETNFEPGSTKQFYYPSKTVFPNAVISNNRSFATEKRPLTSRTVSPVRVSLKTVKPTSKILPTNKSMTVGHQITTRQPNNGTRQDTCENCFMHDFKYIIQNQDVCNTSLAEKSQIDLIVFIFSVHDHFKERDVIRQTWLSVSNGNTGNIRHVFLLGYVNNGSMSKKVEEENDVHHDIIKESFVDTYHNLTYKTIMGFKWVTHFCSSARFVMKTDDDMYVNLPAIVEALNKEEKQLQTTVSGTCALVAKPIRNTKSKWYASIWSYPHDSYPGFCSGTGYVTSRTVAEQIYNISKTVPFFHLEDVYVALCVKKLGFKLRHLPGFHNYRTKLDPCVMKSNSILTSHGVPLDFLIKIRDAKC